MKAKSKSVKAKHSLKTEVKRVKTEFHHIKERVKKMADEHKGGTAQASAEPKREMTKAEAEEVLDRLHYCKKHGTKMKADEHGAWHCEMDDKEQAAAEEALAKEAWAVYSKGAVK